MAISLNTFLERNFEIIKIKIYFDLSSQITLFMYFLCVEICGI